jgi:hypothetical protein
MLDNSKGRNHTKYSVIIMYLDIELVSNYYLLFTSLCIILKSTSETLPFVSTKDRSHEIGSPVENGYEMFEMPSRGGS